MLDVLVELAHPESFHLRFQSGRQLSDRERAQARVLRFRFTDGFGEVERGLVGIWLPAFDSLDGQQLATRVAARHLVERVGVGTGIEEVRGDVRVELQALEVKSRSIERDDNSTGAVREFSDLWDLSLIHIS